MNDSFYNRIDYQGPIENVLHLVCRDFGLGRYISYELVPFGYEDLNVILHTNKSTYFVKIFGSFRKRTDCKRYVEVMQTVYKNGISYPFLYKSSKGYLYELTLEHKKIRLVVQQYINGKNFIELGVKPDVKEKEFIIHQTSLINKLPLKPKTVYDSWAVMNFEKEFKKRNKCLSKDLQSSLKNVLDDFVTTTMNKLPYCFVHGDIIRSNIMKDTNGKIYIIDFAVSNFYPRIVEFAALICFNFFDPDNPKSLQEVFNFTLEQYQKFTKLEEIELKILPFFIKASFAMYVLRANYEKVAFDNKSEENLHWLQVGTAGLSFSP